MCRRCAFCGDSQYGEELLVLKLNGFCPSSEATDCFTDLRVCSGWQCRVLQCFDLTGRHSGRCKFALSLPCCGDSQYERKLLSPLVLLYH
jgi:hypothetical protein